LAVYSNEFILGNAHIGSKMINCIATNTLAIIVFQKVTRVTSHRLYYSISLKCTLPARMLVEC